MIHHQKLILSILVNLHLYIVPKLIYMPRYNWNTAKFGVKHQPINQPKWILTFTFTL